MQEPGQGFRRLPPFHSAGRPRRGCIGAMSPGIRSPAAYPPAIRRFPAEAGEPSARNRRKLSSPTKQGNVRSKLPVTPARAGRISG
jgi:hypothetical protein